MFWNRKRSKADADRTGTESSDVLAAELAAIDEAWADLKPATSRSLVTIESLGTTVVATIVDGDLTADKVSDLSYELRQILEKNEQARNLVLDLQSVDYMDSTCLNMFVELLRTVKESGGGIAVASAVQHVEVLFKLTRLDQLFPIRRNVMDAIAAVERKSA